MRGRAKTCNVVEGRIRVSCPRCERKWYLAVPAGIRRKSVRCTCGMSTQYTLNHRAAMRETTCGKALLFLASGRQCPVYLCDLSLGGSASTSRPSTCAPLPPARRGSSSTGP